MQKVITAYKNIGETPLERLELVRAEQGIASDIPMTYAGRLDPMAEGLLIILTGDECKKKEEYLGLDKEYEVEVLFGVQTDSHDVLGLIEKVSASASSQIDFSHYVGKFNQEYPRYSSRIISLKEVPEEMPTKAVEIFSLEKIEETSLAGKEIAHIVLQNVSKVKGEFRQEDIIAGWNDFFANHASETFSIVKIKVSCSSGTYMRSLAHRMGGLAFSIKRTKVGEYSI